MTQILDRVKKVLKDLEGEEAKGRQLASYGELVRFALTLTKEVLETPVKDLPLNLIEAIKTVTEKEAQNDDEKS